MTIKCLAFDLDGTLLLDGSKKIDPRTFDSIQKAMAQGMHIVIASGRDKNGCKFVYEPLGLENGNHFLALVNGQVVYDFENKEYDLDDVLTAEDGVKIQKVCKEFGVEGIFQCGYDFYSYISSLNRVKKKVKNAILGEWGKNDIYMIVDNKGITINCNGEKDRFENSDIQQFGTIAIVLYKKEEPRYVIALNKNCELDEATYIIKKDGTITLAKISMDKTVAYELNCMTYKGNLQNYKIVDMDPYSYRIKNGTLYVKYNEDRVVEAPEDFSNNGYTFNKYNYQISNEKTVFPYRQNGKTYLIYSDNKGITWNKVEIDGNSTIENIHFINSQIGFMLQFEDMAMTVAFGHISKTVDGGKTWQIINKGIGEEKIFRKESQIRFFSENLGFVTMTYSGEKCDLYITTDGGQNFKKIELTPSNWNEEMQWKEIYDYYNLPELESGRLTIEVGQGTDGDYNGGNTVKFYSDDNGISWKEEVV